MHPKAKRLGRLALLPVLMLLAGLSTGVWGEEAASNWELNMSPGATDVGHRIYDLHMTIIWICAAIGVVVFSVMLYSIIAHRKSPHRKAAEFHESTKVEIAWTVVPFIILIVIAVPATSTLLEVYDTEEAEMDVLITGYQWKWKYEYIEPNGENVSFFSNLRTPKEEIYNQTEKGEHYLLDVDEPLVLPVDTKVRLLVTANDVIHSWWVPKLAVKKDAIPGFINDAWTRVNETGIYRGQCAELCGRDHGFMPIVVNVVERDEYDQWLADKKEAAAKVNELMQQDFTLQELVERGEAVYQRNCVACHGAEGQGGVGTAIAGSSIVTGDIRGHLDVVVNGVQGTAMQAFGAQLNPVELAAVTTYQRNAFGNNMGDKVSPLEVYQFQQGQ